ncbi:MAG: hypothetical protein ABIQ15_04205 [Nocardioides sp.]
MLPLEVQIDAMSNVRSRLIEMRDAVHTGDFKDIGGPMKEFGGFDRTPMLSHHHELAHGVVLEGLETMVKSIDLFYDSLVALQDNIANTDEDSAARMKALADLADASYLPGTEGARDRYQDEHGG